MDFNAQELTVIGTLTGTLLGGLFGFLTAWISKRSDERKSFNDLVVRVASEQYIHEIDTAVKKPGGDWVMPYQVYLFDILQLAKIVNKPFLRPKRIVRLLEQADRINKAVMDHAIAKKP